MKKKTYVTIQILTENNIYFYQFYVSNLEATFKTISIG